MRLKTLVLSLAALSMLLAPGNSQACLHSSTKFKGNILNRGYEGLIFHAEGREELILNVQAGFSEVASADTEIGWVLALPAVPDAYDAKIDARVFLEASKLIHKLGPQPKSNARGGFSFGEEKSKKAPIKVVKLNVGPYEIHQIETLGDGAVAAMNKWFGENKFAKKDPKDMAFFVERRYTFLCIKVKPGDSKSGFGKLAKLPPLRVSFAAKKPFFPLKFSSHGGVFPLSLYLFTAKPIDWMKSEDTMKRLGWPSSKNMARHPHMNYEVKTVLLKGQIAKLYRKIKNKTKAFKSPKMFFVNHIQAYGLNSKRNPISKWTDDIWFELNEDPHRAQVRKYMRSALLAPGKADTFKKKILKLGAKAKPCLTEIAETSSLSAARILANELLKELGS